MIDRLIDERYQIRSRIARGGMATVYLATDTRLQRRVALKVMHGHLADDSEFQARFIREAHAAARLAHPNVVSVFDQGHDNDMAYLVMEYLPGMTLRELLRNHGSLTPVQAVDILSSVLSGLAAAHSAGIVHRDLKPENVLLANDGRIKIGDFGLARAVTANTATGQALMGTIAYLSPELLTRGIADARSDIYALGIMLYEMLTGEQPFQGEQPMHVAYQHAHDTVPVPSTRNPDVPEALDDVVGWATSRNPDERPHDAEEMLASVREIEDSLADPSSSATTVIRRGVSNETAIMGATLGGITAETQALHAPPSPAPEATGAGATPSATLARKQARRKRRGVWIFAAVLVCATLAGGAGWYFNAGPGAQTLVPVLSGITRDAAATLLTKAGLSLGALTDCTHPTATRGTVISSTPSEGAPIGRGNPVGLCLSSGPKLLPVPDVLGLSEKEARAKLSAFTVGASQVQFSDDDAGTVLDIFDSAGDTLGSEYGEQQPVTLLISAGPLPDVRGMSKSEVVAALSEVDLSIATTEEVFSDDVPAGLAIVALPVVSPVHPGDEIFVRFSKGPELVAVPNVVGQTWSTAKETLSAAGFSLNYNFAADLAPGLVRVSSTDPTPGSLVEKKATITVSF